MTVQTELMRKLDAAEEEMVAIRRHLHEHPEVSFQEKETAAYIKAFYRDLDCTVTDFGEGYGFAVDIDRDHPGKKACFTC